MRKFLILTALAAATVALAVISLWLKVRRGYMTELVASLLVLFVGATLRHLDEMAMQGACTTVVLSDTPRRRWARG